MKEAYAELEHSLHTALETYSNVHRGSGHNSLVSTHLYEQVREIVIEHLGLDKSQYTVVFCTPRRAEQLSAQLKSKRCHILSSQDIELPLGLRAVAVPRAVLPGGAPFQPGGGTARLVFPNYVIWARGADKYEAGTPAIVNVVALARALRLIRQFGPDAFQNAEADTLSAADILYHDALEPYAGRELLEKLRHTLIGQRVPVPTLTGDKPYINLDNAASTPTFAPIWQAVCQAWRRPQAVQRAIVPEVKSICAAMLNAPPAAYDVIFTTNTTEAINLVTDSLRRETRRGPKPLVINTILEHNSNELPWRSLPGATLIRLPVDAEGFVDLNQLETYLRAAARKPRLKLVAISGASNVLGVYNDLTEISNIAHRHGARLLVDAAQLVAHRKIDMDACGVDYLAFSAHKAYAPFGTGVLVVRKGLLAFDPVERVQIEASGEENVGGIAALGKALVLLQRVGLDVIQQEEQALTARALHGLARIPGLTIFGLTPDSPRFDRKGAVIVFRMVGKMANRVARELAERGGIGARYGCHCAHLLIKSLLQIPPWQALLQGMIVSLFPQVSLPGLTRISLGIQNTAEEIDTLLGILDAIARQPHGDDNPFASAQTDIQRKMADFVRATGWRVYPQH
ncbi:MAG TPA: aminotransferase class V-fold PLP-dependent enzyme [Anaerolineae bacterium]|nr:aminotransferase class V-fold PLP-dependent enzyme [Anaerolineae bacterium]